MPLAVVEADRLDPLEAVERPGQAGGRVLPAGEQHQRPVAHRDLPLGPYAAALAHRPSYSAEHAGVS